MGVWTVPTWTGAGSHFLDNILSTWSTFCLASSFFLGGRAGSPIIQQAHFCALGPTSFF